MMQFWNVSKCRRSWYVASGSKGEGLLVRADPVFDILVSIARKTLYPGHFLPDETHLSQNGLFSSHLTCLSLNGMLVNLEAAVNMRDANGKIYERGAGYSLLG